MSGSKLGGISFSLDKWERTGLFLSVSVIPFVVLLYLYWNTPQSNIMPLSLEWIEESPPIKLAEYSLLGENNRQFKSSELLGNWQVIVFGFTSCTDVCPMALSLLSKTLNRLNNLIALLPSLETPRGVFISVDPDRDSPDFIKKYVEFFNRKFLGLTGEHTELRKIINSLQAGYLITKDNGGVNINHPTSFFLINPEGYLMGLFIHPSNSENIANEIFLQMKKYELNQ